MTFNKMRFPIVWITFVLCVALCSFVEVQCGPVSHRQDVDIAFDGKDQEPAPRSARQAASDEDDDDDSEEDDDDAEQQLNFPAAPNRFEEDGDDDYEGRSFRRIVREISQKPVAEVEADDEESVIPSADTPAVPEKKPSVLELLSSALDKAIEATSKIPTQQVASDAAGVFQILGQVFSEAIDKVIGSDDGPEDNTEAAPESIDNKVPEEPPVLPVIEQQSMKVETQDQETSQSDKEIVNNL